MSNRREHDELDRLLQGEEPAERALLAAFLRGARQDLPEAPRPDVAERHLAAITAAAAEAAHRPAVVVPTSAGSPWRARVRRLAGLTAVKVVIGVSAAAAATGTGLATTGNLPDPMQRAVAGVVERVGIELPVPDAVPPVLLPAETPSTVPPREAPAPDDAGDGRQPTPARPEGGAPPAEVPGEGDPPANPSERGTQRDDAGRDEGEPPSRRPEDAGPDADERGRGLEQGRGDRAPAGAPPEDSSDEDGEGDREAPDPERDDGDDAGAADETGTSARAVPPRVPVDVPARANR